MISFASPCALHSLCPYVSQESLTVRAKGQQQPQQRACCASSTKSSSSTGAAALEQQQLLHLLFRRVLVTIISIHFFFHIVNLCRSKAAAATAIISTNVCKSECMRACTCTWEAGEGRRICSHVFSREILFIQSHDLPACLHKRYKHISRALHLIYF